jgi:hypothetical protein
MTDVPQHVAPPPMGKVGDQVQLSIEAGEGQVHVHFGTLVENIVMSPADARQMSKVLLKSALASEAKAVDKLAQLVGPDLAMEILEKRAANKEAVAAPEEAAPEEAETEEAAP